MTPKQTKKNEEKSSFFAIYISRMRAFSRNARLYLIVAMLSGIAAGIQGLLFNFYILSLGYNEAVIGNIVTVRYHPVSSHTNGLSYRPDRQAECIYPEHIDCGTCQFGYADSSFIRNLFIDECIDGFSPVPFSRSNGSFFNGK